MSTLRPRILFENQHVIAINKHAGQSFHGGPHIKGYFQHMKEILMDEHFYDESGIDLYPVHRLDAITSGVLLMAKNKASAREFQELFAAGTHIHKYYVALSDRKPRKKMGTISGDVVKGRRGSYKLTQSRDSPSVTKFVSKKIILQDGSPEDMKSLYFFLVKPITGKTHQIRVAMKSLGSPILGDGRYGCASQASHQERGHLHCAAIRCTIAGDSIEIICNPCEDGGYFQSTECSTIFTDEWFSPENTQRQHLWFPKLSLLSSSLSAHP